MYSKKFYSFDPRDSRTQRNDDSTSGRGSCRTSFTKGLFNEPVEGKIDRESHVMKEDARSISENVTKSVVTRNIIDRRSSSSYKTREDVKAIKTRDLKGITNTYTDTSKIDSTGPSGAHENVKDSPISSFYSSYSKDEDLRDTAASHKIPMDGESVISSFYRSGSGKKTSDQLTRTDKKVRDPAGASKHTVWTSGLDEERREEISVTGKEYSSDPIGRRSSLVRHRSKDDGSCDREPEDSKTVDLEDVNILKRALERKQVSNSLEREKLANRISEDEHRDPAKYSSSAYLLLSNKWKHKDTASSVLPVDNSNNKYDGAAERQARCFESNAAQLSRRRSSSPEALDNKARSRLGIYRELPGRKEFLSCTAKARLHEDDELLRKRRDSGSLDREDRRVQDYTDQREREKRNLLSRVRSKSSDDLSYFHSEGDGAVDQNRFRSRSLHRRRSTERERFHTGDVAGITDFGTLDARSYMPRKESATHEKLREDIARLKAETKTRSMKKDNTFLPYSHSGEPSIRDKLKEDIAKLKIKTLTREHIKPYVPPLSSRAESKDVSSSWKNREPYIQEKLKDDIAKLRAETRDLPSPSTRDRDTITYPSHKKDEERDVHRSELPTSTLERFQCSKKDGKVFKDELEHRETQRYDDPMEHKYGYKAHKDGDLSQVDGAYRRERRPNTDRNPKDSSSPESSDKHYGPVRDYSASSLRRFSEKTRTGYFPRTADYDWPPKEKKSLTERRESLNSPRNLWDDATQTGREARSGSTQGYATKRVFRADSTVSMKSTKNGDHGPSSVTGFFHGSVSEEDQSAFYSKGMGNEDTGVFREPFERHETFRPTEGYRTTESRPSDSSIPLEPTWENESSALYVPSGQPQSSRKTESTRLCSSPKSTVRPEEAIPLPYPDHDSVTSRKREDSIVPLRDSRDFSTQKEVESKETELFSNRRQTSHEFVTSEMLKTDSIISREAGRNDSDPSISRLETIRGLPERNASLRRTSIRREIITPDVRKIPSLEEVVEIVEEHKESKPSAMIELRKKIEELKNKVDKLDDSKSRSRLERYVHQHSEKKPDVEVKDPVYIPRYQPRSARLPERDYNKTDATDALAVGTYTDETSETTSRQISRQTSVASTIQRMISVREDDLTTTRIQDEASREDDSQMEEKPAVMIQRRDAETMTAPEIQEQVGMDRIRRMDSFIANIVEEPDKIDELRGVPFDRQTSVPNIQEVENVRNTTDSGMTIINIDSEQQALSPKADKHRWWDAFTAEDVDRLLHIENRTNLNGYTSAYTAEDMDKLLHLGPVRRRSFRRGSYDRRSLRRHPRRSKDDIVDVHVKVRGKHEKRRRPQYILAQAAPEEKAIVLRDTKESADPYIRKIKVDDVYGADAVRVENGVVKIKVGDLTTRGRKAWARILQQKDRVVESDGTVTIPVNRDEYEDGVYYTNYYEEQGDGAVRIPIRFKIQEDNRFKTKKLHVTKETRRHGSIKRSRRANGSRAYIVGVRYYHGNKLMSSAHGYGSRGQQQRAVWRTLRGSSKAAGNEIVLRRNQPYTVPMHTIQRIHEGYRTTRQASSYKDEGGKMVITVNAVPTRPPRLSLQKPGETLFQSSGMLTSNSHHVNANAPQDALATTPNYALNSLSKGAINSQGYTIHSIQGGQGTPYIVTDPSNSYRRRFSGSTDTSRFHASPEVSSTPIIVPYDDDIQPVSGTERRIDVITDPSSFSQEDSSRISVSNGRLKARTTYGEKFNLKDYGDITKLQYVSGTSRSSNIINDRRWGNRRYKYGPPSNYKQQERLNGRTMSWAVEEVAPDF